MVRASMGMELHPDLALSARCGQLPFPRGITNDWLTCGPHKDSEPLLQLLEGALGRSVPWHISLCSPGHSRERLKSRSAQLSALTPARCGLKGTSTA